MGLDIYAGTLTRYYSGNWELLSQQFTKEQGMGFAVCRPEGACEPISEPEEIRELRDCIQRWQDALSQSLPEECKEAMWEEVADKAYFTDNMGFEAWMALTIFQYGTLLKKPFPETIERDTMLNCPLLEEGREKQIRSSLMDVQMWLPLKRSYKFTFVTPQNVEAEFATVAWLEDELDALNQLTWQADEPTILSWKNSEYYNPVPEKHKFFSRFLGKKDNRRPVYYTESLAKCAYSMLYSA